MARSQRPLFLLAIPLVVLAVAGSFFLGTDPPPATPTLGDQSLTQAPLSPSTGGAATLQGDQPGPQEAQPQREVAEDDGTEAAARAAAPRRVVRGARVPRASHFVEGRVQLPEGTPLDEEIFVIASGRRFKTLAGHPDEYSAPVDTDGNFRVAFAEGTRKGRIWIAGRYCFSSDNKVIDPTNPEDTNDLLLEPSLGGRFDVEVVAPRAAAGNLEFHEKVTVEMRENRTWGGSGGRVGVRTKDVHFEIGGVNPGKDFLVEARHPDFANGETKGLKAEPGVITQVVVNFGRGATISGEVRNIKGELITHASVMALTVAQARNRNPFMNEKIDEVVEGGDGTFELVGVPPGDLIVLVAADGYLELRDPLGEIVEGEVRTSLVLSMDKGLTVEGSVTWPKGSPASGAMVRLSQKTEFMSFPYEAIMGEVKVGADGEFSFSGLGEGQCHLEATSFERGYVAPAEASLRERLLDPPPVWRAVAADVKPSRRGLVLILSEGQTVPGKVLDDEGNPVPRFQITATPASNNILSNTARKPIKDRFRAPDGRFDLAGLQDGSWTLVARGLGFGTGDEQEITVPFDGEVALRLPRESKLSGVVRDPSGKPIQGAQVNGRHGGGKDARTETNEEGVFDLVRLNPGEVVISASHASWANSPKLTMFVAAGDTGEGALLTLRRGATLTVEMHTALGKINDRQVRLSGPSWKSGNTDESGSVLFEGLEPGAYTVSLESSGRARGPRDRNQWIMNNANKEEVKVTLVDEERRIVVLGTPSPTAVTVSGTVRSAGEGVAKAAVSVLDPENPNQQLAATIADVDGNYELVVDQPGTYQFMVGRGWSSQGVFPVAIEGGSRHRADFELPNSGLDGIIRGPSGTLEGATLALAVTIDGVEVGGRSRRRTTRSGVDGRYNFSDLSPGTYNLRAMESDPGDLAGGAILVEGLEVEAEGTTLDIDLELAGTLEGTVRDADGNGLRRATLDVTTEDGTRIMLASWVRTRGGGSYTMTGLAPGDVWVSARYEGRSSPRVKVRVSKGNTRQHDIVIP